MDYYNNKKVVSWKTFKNGVYEGIVSGSESNMYTVHIDTEHPGKSFCNCPFADGRRVVCKHMIALYFTAEPNQEQLLDEMVQLEERRNYW